MNLDIWAWAIWQVCQDDLGFTYCSYFVRASAHPAASTWVSVQDGCAPGVWWPHSLFGAVCWRRWVLAGIMLETDTCRLCESLDSASPGASASWVVVLLSPQVHGPLLCLGQEKSLVQPLAIGLNMHPDGGWQWHFIGSTTSLYFSFWEIRSQWPPWPAERDQQGPKAQNCEWRSVKDSAKALVAIGCYLMLLVRIN